MYGKLTVKKLIYTKQNEQLYFMTTVLSPKAVFKQIDLQDKSLKF